MTWIKCPALERGRRCSSPAPSRHIAKTINARTAHSRRGPLVCCVEEVDNPGGPVHTLALPRGVPVEAESRGTLSAGAIALTAKAWRLVAGDGEGALYTAVPPALRNTALTAMPYHL